MTLHERIAEALGWSVEDARSFSLAALRDLVLPIDKKLAHEITLVIRSGAVMYAGPRLHGNKDGR